MADRAWVDVKSSRLKAADYDPLSRTMFLKFHPDKNGMCAVYAYANVTPEVFRDFMESPSRGKYFGQRFYKNDDYPARKMEPEPAEPEEPTAA